MREGCRSISLMDVGTCVWRRAVPTLVSGVDTTFSIIKPTSHARQSTLSLDNCRDSGGVWRRHTGRVDECEVPGVAPLVNDTNRSGAAERVPLLKLRWQLLDIDHPMNCVVCHGEQSAPPWGEVCMRKRAYLSRESSPLALACSRLMVTRGSSQLRLLSM